MDLLIDAFQHTIDDLELPLRCRTMPIVKRRIPKRLVEQTFAELLVQLLQAYEFFLVNGRFDSRQRYPPKLARRPNFLWHCHVNAGLVRTDVIAFAHGQALISPPALSA